MFKVGDKVKAIDSSDEGEVLEVKNQEVLVALDSGFEEWFFTRQLIIKQHMRVDKVQRKDPQHTKQDQHMRFANQKVHKIEIDVHFNQLVDFPKNYTSAERLTIQLNAVKRAVDKARVAGVKRVIIIHGVGEGILKESIHSMLETMDRLRFFDASFAEYGRGATEVELF